MILSIMGNDIMRQRTKKNRKKTINSIYIVVLCAINAFTFNFAHEASSREVEFTRAASLFRLSIVLVNYQWNVRAARHPEGSRMRPPGPAAGDGWRRQPCTHTVRRKKKRERTFVFDNQRMSHLS